MKLAVIIPVYKIDFIQNLSYDLPNDIDIYIVDNGNVVDYTANDNWSILKPGSNLRWTKGTNYGMKNAFNDWYDGYVLMNDDVRLSPGFFDGLRRASEALGHASIVAPLYDDVYDHQKPVTGYKGPAANYQVPVYPGLRVVPFVDFTCVMIPHDVWRKVGYLDTTHFGEYGWGADYDYCLRARELGILTFTTDLSYLNHMHQGTAKTIDSNWNGLAGNEMEAGMTAKYGPEWRDRLWKP